MEIRRKKRNLERLGNISPGCIVSDTSGKNIYLVTDDNIEKSGKRMPGLVSLQNGKLIFYNDSQKVKQLEGISYHLYEKNSRTEVTDENSTLPPGTVFKTEEDPEPFVKAAVTDNRDRKTQIAFGIYSGKKRVIRGRKKVTVYHDAAAVI